MTISREHAEAAIANLTTPEINHLYAQAHARYVLMEVEEDPTNFPAFDAVLDDKVTFAAYGLLACGCSLIEQDQRADGARILEQSASLLEYVHGHASAESRESGFHRFVSGMALYAAGHYSRAFVVIGDMEAYTPATRIIAAFLRKDVGALVERLNEVLLRETPHFEDQIELDEWALTIATARAVALALEFALTGRDELLVSANDQLESASIIASTGRHPAWWWIIRLLRLMLTDLRAASPWHVLPPFFGPGSAELLGTYTRLLAFGRPPLVELWTSQRAALPLALSSTNRGAVLSLPTSAGKTRIAELAILHTLCADPNAHILYIAPFRSLAIEVEDALGGSLRWLGYNVSHIYGGSRVSATDSALVQESTVTIATPEKARALLRVMPELFDDVKLVIVDEGHLIGPSPRDVRNEIFLDHLRLLARANGARVLLLSAVLPNPQDLAEWLVGDAQAVATSDWRPSRERFGLLLWNGSRVRLEWKGEVDSFNPSFVEVTKDGLKGKQVPSNKREAVAAAAVRLSAVGPVMIFAGQAQWVPAMTRAALTALGPNPRAHPWARHEWRVFEALCLEDLGPESPELTAARAGVVSHSNSLPTQVRLALERLMRATPPRIIVATTTLAQGVNVGISCVIVATPYIGAGTTISTRDFWNICGRAGRAFVDGEGKVLYAIDETREAWVIDKDQRLARAYFGGRPGDPVKSGVLEMVKRLRETSAQAGVSFDLLLELAASNDFSSLGEQEDRCAAICDLLDDELLALHTDPTINPSSSSPEAWIEGVFRDSLAVLQASTGPSTVGADDVLAVLQARAIAAVNMAADSDPHAIVASGLPLRAALRVSRDLDLFGAIADAYARSRGLESLVSAIHALEEWAREHAASIAKNMPSVATLDALRVAWLAGESLHSHILNLGGTDTKRASLRASARQLYEYDLPWIIHAAAQQLRVAGESEQADTLDEIALLVELGLPTDAATRIFLAGVRSRVAATEIAALGVEFGTGTAQTRRLLATTAFAQRVQVRLSAPSSDWLDLLREEDSQHRPGTVPPFASWTERDDPGVGVLHARKLDGNLFLCSTDGSVRFNVSPTEARPFDRLANDHRMAFTQDGSTWRLTPRDPRLS